MTTYLVISDTHDNLTNVRLLKKHLGTTLKSVKYIIHLGDITSPFTLRELINLERELIVITGNNDGDKILLKNIYDGIEDPPLEVNLCSLKALLLHGFKDANLTLRIVNSIARGGYYDIVLFGHTHKHYLDVISGTLVMNPGTLSGYLSPQPTYGILDFNEGKAYVISLTDGRHLLSTSIPKIRNRH